MVYGVCRRVDERKRHAPVKKRDRETAAGEKWLEGEKRARTPRGRSLSLSLSLSVIFIFFHFSLANTLRRECTGGRKREREGCLCACALKRRKEGAAGEEMRDGGRGG